MAGDPDTDWTAGNLIARITRPYRAGLVLALAMNFAVGFAIAFQNVIPKYIIDNALLAADLTLDERKVRLVFFAGAYAFAGIVCRALLWHSSLRIFGKIREKCLMQLRSLFFNRVNHLCIAFHNRHNSGELFSYLFGSPLQNIQQYYQQAAMILPSMSVAIVMTLVYLGSWDPLLSGIMAVTIVVHFYVQRKARLRVKEIHRDYQQSESKVSGRVADLLRGHRAVKLHALEDHAYSGFVREAEVIRMKSYRRDVTAHLQHVKQESVLYLGYAILCIAAGYRFLGGHLTEGQLTAYLTAFIALQGPLGMIFQTSLLRGGAQASLERIAAVLATSSTTPDPDEVQPSDIPAGGEIVFENVRFAYREEPVVRDLSVSIPYGQKVALVGPSGAGKSTLVQLVLRLYDPQQGAVRIGGRNLRECSGRLVRNRFGVVPQDPYIFNTTVRGNLSIVDPAADDAALRAACEQSNAWEFIEKLPAGLDTPIGEGGSNLSGGQKQRLAIARALLAKPDYFIFDEATSALDSISEKLIKDAMSRVTHGRTAFFIAHRLASIDTCDRILVLRDGRIEQDGDYATLTQSPGLFADLIRSQELG